MREAHLFAYRLAVPAIALAAALALANVGRPADSAARAPESARAAAPIMADAISRARGQTCLSGGESALDLATWGALDDSAVPTPCPTAAIASPRGAASRARADLARPTASLDRRDVAGT